MIQNLAKGSLGNIAEPLQATFFLIRDAAAEAGSAAGGVLNALMDIKSIGTIHTWIITHHRDVYEPSIDNTGGGDGGGGGGDGTCFVIHTPVMMADGTIKEIERIEIGDRVLSWDTATGKPVEAEVCKVFHHDRSEVRGYAVINDVLCVTTEHPLWANGQWVEVAYMRRGDRLMDADGDPVVIESIGYVEEQAEVFNLHTSHPTHNYFAGGVLAHNAAKKAAGGPVRAGGVYLVGEQRPEIFVPDTSGMIVPNARRFLAQLNAAMGSVIQATAASAGAAVDRGAERGAGRGAAGTTQVTIYGLTIEGVQDARGLLGELQAMA
jgi:hypothetical protein